MISKGNTKLGALIHSFSIPAKDTCPGLTDACAAVCYADPATGGHFGYPKVQKLYHRNWQITLGPHFVADMLAEIRQKRVKILRIHVSGDFYDAGYIRKWIQIVKTCSSTHFFVYTRSWRLKRLRASLGEFNRLKNSTLWWSADKDTHAINGRPPRWKGVRVAYMVNQYDEWVPAYADLVFRHRRKHPEKYRDGRLVCPSENGVKTTYKITCSDCGLCYQNREIPKHVREQTRKLEEQHV